MLRLSFGIKIRSLASRVIPVAAPRVMRLMTTKIQTNGSEQETPVGVVAFMQGRSRDLVANPPNKALQEMAERCKLSEDTVHKLWENFTYVDKGLAKTDGATGHHIQAEEFAIILEKAGVTNAELPVSLFAIFDRDGDGSIDFRAFVTGMALLTSKDPDHRAELLFSLSDLNKNGVIERFEMFSIVKSLADAAQQLGGEFPPPPGMEFLDLEKRTIAIAEVTTKSVFEELKKEKNHTISKEELHAWLHSGSPTAVLVGSWYDAFSAGRYRASLLDLDRKAQKDFKDADVAWLDTERGRAWFDARFGASAGGDY